MICNGMMQSVLGRAELSCGETGYAVWSWQVWSVASRGGLLGEMGGVGGCGALCTGDGVGM